MADDREPRGFCCAEDLDRIGADGVHAEDDLRAWRERGPRDTTRELIEAVRAEGVEGAIVLDVGAGVGAVHVALLEAGAAAAIDVDASRLYLRTARGEADRRGLADRVTYRHGDLVAVAPELPNVDIVTLDSVVCCYPALDDLLAAALDRTPRVVGLVHPRDGLWMRAVMRLLNGFWAVRRVPDRWYIHRRADIDRRIEARGLRLAHDGGSRFWRVAVYRRVVVT